MSFNYVGLGFSFGIKDLGVEDFQTNVSKGWEKFNTRVDSAVKALKPFEPSFQKVVDSLGDFVRAVPGFEQVESALHKVDQAFSGTAETTQVFAKSFEETSDAVNDFSLDQFERTLRDTLSTARLTSSDIAKVMAIAMERASRSFHKESTRIIVDSETLQRVFKKIQEAGASLKSLVSLGRLQTVFQGIGTGILASINKFKSSIGGLLNANINLTTGLEAEGAALGKSAKATGATLGYTGKELRRFTSQAAGMAAGLNMDAATAGKAIHAFAKGQSEFRAIGITSASQLAKLQEIGVMNVDQMLMSFRRARDQLQFTDEGLRSLTSGLHAVGVEAGAVPQMMESIPELLEMLGGVTDHTGQLLRGAKLEEFAMQTVAASAGFFSIYKDAGKASQAAIQLGKSISENRESFHQLFTGTNSEFPEIAANLLRMGVNTDDVFKMMQEGPEGVVRGLATIAQRMKGVGQNSEQVGATMSHLRGWLGKAFSPEVGILIEDMTSKMGDADSETLKLMASVRTATADFGKIADEGHSTGRTLQESFDRMKEGAIMSFRSISRQAAVTFVKDTGKSLGVFNKTLKEVAAKGGPMAEIIKKMSLMNQIGSLALIPETLRPMAVLFQEAGGQIVNFVGTLAPVIGPLGAAFVGLSGPMMGLVAVAGALAIPLAYLSLRLGMLLLEGKSFKEALSTVGVEIQEFATGSVMKLGSAVDWVQDKLASIDLKAVFSKVFQGVAGLFTGGGTDLFGMLFGAQKDEKTGETNAEAMKKKLEGIGAQLSGMWKTISQSFIAAAKEVNWSGVFVGVVEELTYFLITLPNELFSKVMSIDFAPFFTGLIERFSSGFASAGKGVGDAGLGQIVVNILFGIAEASTRVVQGVVKLLATVVDVILQVNWAEVASNLWSGLTAAFDGASSILPKIANNLWGWIKGAFDTIVAKVPALANMLAEALPKLVSSAVEAMSFAETSFEEGKTWVAGLVDTLGGYIQVGLEWLWQKVPEWLESALTSAVQWLGSIDWAGMGISLLKGILSLWATVQSTLVGLPPTLLGYLAKALTWIFEKIPKFIEEGLPKALSFLDNLPKLIEDMLSGAGTGNAAGGFIGSLFEKFADAFGKWWPTLVGIFTKLVPALFEALYAIINAAIPLLLKLYPTIFKVVSLIFGKVMDWSMQFVYQLLESVKTYLKETFPSLAGPIGFLFTFLQSLALGLLWIFKAVWQRVLKGFEQVWTGVGSVLEGIVAGLEGFVAGLSWLWEGIGAGLDWLWEAGGAGLAWLSDAWGKTWDFLSSAASKVVAHVMKEVKWRFELIQKVVAWALDRVRKNLQLVRTVAQTVFSFLSTAWDVVKTNWEEAIAGIQLKLDTWMGWFRGIWAEIKAKATEVGDALLGPWKAVSAVMSNFQERAKNFFAPFMAAAVSFGTQFVAKIRQAVGTIASYLLEVFKKLEVLPASVRNHIPGLDSMRQALEGVVQAGRSAAISTSAVATASGVLQEHITKFPEAFAKYNDVFNVFRARAKTTEETLQSLQAQIQTASELPESTDKSEKLQALTRQMVQEGNRLSSLQHWLSGGLASAFGEVAGASSNGEEAMRKFNARVNEIVASVGKAVGNSIQWDWWEAMNVMIEASDQSAAGIGHLAESMNDISKTSSNTVGAGFADNLAKSAHDATKIWGNMAAFVAHNPVDADMSLNALALDRHKAKIATEVKDTLSLRSEGNKELLATINSPLWYNDWRTVYLRSIEEVKQILIDTATVSRSPRGSPRSTQAPARGSDYLARTGVRGHPNPYS